MNTIFFVILLFITISCFNFQEDKPRKIIFPEMTGLAQSIIDSLGNDLITVNQREYKLYFEKNTHPDKNQTDLVKLIDDSIIRIKKVLKISEYNKGFYLVFFDSRKMMEKIIGWGVKGYALLEHDMGLFVYNPDIRSYIKHELFHLFAFNVWGHTPSRLLNEGGAVFADDECLHYENHLSVINKYLYSNNMWFEINDLINNFTEKQQENDMIAYLQAGFIFRYLYENHDINKLKSLWQKGLVEFENIYGYSLTDLEERVFNELDKLDLIDVDWEELMELGCG